MSLRARQPVQRTGRSTRRVGRSVVAVTATLTSLTVVAACGDAADLSGCAQVVRVLADGTETLRDLAADPAQAQQRLADLAVDLREAGANAGEEVRAAAERVATTYEQIAAGAESGEVPDMSVLTDATTALADACRP